jgi:diguanylate cyclase (GGDEF)-like protein
MTDLPAELEVAQRLRTLFLLDARIAAARDELAQLDKTVAEGIQRRPLSRHARRLLQANERLVLSALDAQTAEQVARADLDELERLGQRDALTNLPNRVLTLDRLETAIATARRSGHRLGVLFVDLDAFKAINDTLGHAAGDASLRVAASRLSASVRESDTVGRLGGDEFLVILPDVEGAVEASRVATKMIAAMAALEPASGLLPPLSASIGVAIYPLDGLCADDLVAHADKAMYRAKSLGPGRVEFYDDGASSVSPVDAAPPPPALATAALLTKEWHEARVADLRDANEHLVLAALTAQGLQARAEDLHQRQLKFLAMVAHELRNPLDPIRTAAELLAHAQVNEGLLTRVQTILRRQVGHLARLVDDLLDGARASSGKFRLERSLVVLGDVLGPVIEAMQRTLARRHQTLVAQMPTEEIMIYADPVRLAQVFNNLLENASKYTPAGGRVCVAVERLDDAVTVGVADNGIGISTEALDHVFDLFVQESRARAHDGDGLGIGLAIVRELVEAHGGSIVGSSAGHGFGSQFVVTLPALHREIDDEVASSVG